MLLPLSDYSDKTKRTKTVNLRPQLSNKQANKEATKHGNCRKKFDLSYGVVNAVVNKKREGMEKQTNLLETSMSQEGSALEPMDRSLEAACEAGR